MSLWRGRHSVHVRMKEFRRDAKLLPQTETAITQLPAISMLMANLVTVSTYLHANLVSINSDHTGSSNRERVFVSIKRLQPVVPAALWIISETTGS